MLLLLKLLYGIGTLRQPLGSHPDIKDEMEEMESTMRSRLACAEMHLKFHEDNLRAMIDYETQAAKDIFEVCG